jgi:heme-degrading monooxygenase HmoA
MIPRRSSMFATVGWQTLRPGALPKFLEASKHQGMPDIRQAEGFVAHYLVLVSPNRYLTIRVFDDKADADAWAAETREHSKGTDLVGLLDDSIRGRGQIGGVVLAASSSG